MNVPRLYLKVGAFMLYVGILIAGCLWVLSLIKALFWKMPRETAEQGLERSDEPLLFAFADRLADAVGAPRPDNIRLDLDVNATASYETTAFGLGRRSFTLTLGVPIVAGLTLPQLAGVMAHEFGHFSQRGSTFLDRLIHRVNSWFFAAIARRDMIDDMIESLTDPEDEGALIMFLGFLLWILVGLGKIVLWCLMQVGLFVSSSLLRRMEFDADRYEAAVVGSKVFETTSNRMYELSVANIVATKHVFDTAQGNYLPDDYAGFVAGLSKKSRKVKKKARKLIEKEKAGWLSSHPPTRNRILAAKKQDMPGVLSSSLPSSALFKSFSKCSKSLTDGMYQIHFGRNYMPGTCRPSSEAVESYLKTMEAK